MTTWFITRHAGALQWAQIQQLEVDYFCEHLDIARIQSGDTVMGSLPVHLAAQVCALGAHYLHLSIDLPEAYRGKELDLSELQQFNARLQPFLVSALTVPAP